VTPADAGSRKRLHPALKAMMVLVALAAIGFLFVRSVADTRAEPYEIASAHLSGWTLATDSAQDAEDAAISLRPPAELTMNLFRQLFRRQMESLSTSTAPGIVLALRRELPAGVTAVQLLALAREAGLDRARPAPRCVAYRRVSATGVTRQLYFVWFSLPEYDTFRRSLAAYATDTYRPANLSPVMLTAAEPGFSGWHPVVVDEGRDCVAPITVR
jgi:hypothetical protein